MAEEKILIVEDEEGIVLSVGDRLESEGYIVTSRNNGVAGETEALRGRYDLIILDVMLPDRDGFQICQNIREQKKSVPILMLTARSTSLDTVMGLRLGADDYLTKPFDMQVLMARVQALLRRSTLNDATGAPEETATEYEFGRFTLDTRKQELRRDGEVIGMNAQEYRLLKYFLQNPDRVISRDELLDEVWGYGTMTSTRTVDVHVAWIRQKIDEKSLPTHLLTVRGYGYKFVL